VNLALQRLAIPNTLWVTLQLRETWEYGEQPQRFLLFDRDSRFGADVASIVKAMGSEPLRARLLATT